MPIDPSVPAAPAAKPENVPAKFWDAYRGEIRTDALLKSYLELERRLGRSVPLPKDETDEEGYRRLFGLLGRPDDPSAYDIVPPHALVQPDDSLNRRLHAAGFTQAQAQLVYDLAAEHLVPVLEAMVAELEERRDRERLEAQFGGPKGWAEVAPQIRAWGEANLAPKVFEALCQSVEGVLTMHRMMREEPSLLSQGEADGAPVNQAQLDSLMRDPRYWREHNPEIVARVTEGFKRLYGR